MLVQDQLLEPLLAVPPVQVGLHRHLNLLLPDLGGRAGHWTVHISADSCHVTVRLSQVWSSLTFTPPERDEVWLLVPQQVDEHFSLQLGEGDPHRGSGQVTGMVHLGRLLHLLLGLVGPSLLPLLRLTLLLAPRAPLPMSGDNE